MDADDCVCLIATVGFAAGLAVGCLICGVNGIEDSDIESMIRSDNPGSIEVYHGGWHTGTLTWEPKAERKE